MANPTAQVPMSFGGYESASDEHYWPLDPSLTSDTYYTGELMGFKPASGYAGHLDDTGVFLYLGNKVSDTHRLQSDTPAYDFKEKIRWTRFVDMPVNTGTPALPTNFGDPAYANDSGHVSLSSTTNNNLIGMVVDVCRWGSVGGTAGGVISLTGNGTPQAVRVATAQPGALLGLLVQGIPGPGAAGAAAKTGSINLGAGAPANSGATTAGGAGGSLTVTCGAGGAQTVTSATAAGGVGGTVTLTGGTGGNASGLTSTGNGGAGGNLILNGGAGGTSVGGTAGVPGNVLLAHNIATPAAGSAAAFIQLGSTAGFGIYFGSGAPTVSAAQGSIYLRSDGASTSTRLYVNTTGSTTWTDFTSAA